MKLIMKELTQQQRDEILAEAKRRYPIGTVVRHKENLYVIDKELYWQYPNYISHLGVPPIYSLRSNTWAEIVPTLQNHNISKTESKMTVFNTPNKTKKVYSSFKFNKRTITLCLVYDTITNIVSVGYSVKMKGDKKIEGLSEKIALGRANNPRTNLLTTSPTISPELSNKYILRSILDTIQHKIENDIIVIKGVR